MKVLPRHGVRTAGRAGTALGVGTAILPVLLLLLLVSCLAAQEQKVFKPGEFISRRPPGRWRTIEQPREETLTPEQRAEIERLRSAGHLTGSVEAPTLKGVTVHDRNRAWEGLNFYTSGHEPGAILMDMDGNVLHEWVCPFLKAWPEMSGEPLDENTNYWRAAHLYDNGDVLAVFEGHGIVRLDSDSNVLWSRMDAEHHDLAVTDDGLIYVLTWVPTDSRVVRPGAPILEDFVLVLDENGNEVSSSSVFDALLRSKFAYVFDEVQIYGDIFNINSIAVLADGAVPGLPEFAGGSVLLSLRLPSLLAVMDIDTLEVTWIAGGDWVSQHDPSVLPDGHILLFDNEGNEGRSRLVEFDPVAGENVWTYAGEEPNDFFTQTCGTAQRLPNGNTLAAESDRGRAVEVTSDGTIVWEYYNPARAGDREHLIATVFGMERLPLEAARWLTGDEQGR